MGNTSIYYDGGDRLNFGKEPLKGTRISFCGRGSNAFSRGTNSKAKLAGICRTKSIDLARCKGCCWLGAAFAVAKQSDLRFEICKYDHSFDR